MFMPKGFESIPKEFVSSVRVYDYKTPLSEVLSRINIDGAVVVTKRDEYFGIADSRTVAKKGEIKLPPKFPIGKVARKVPLLDQSTSIEKTILYFFNSATKVLPYTEGNQIKGIIKRETILKAILSLHFLSNYSTGYAMTSPVIAIDSNASVAQARSSMERFKVNKIIVMDQGKVFGILGSKDIINYFTRLSKEETIRKDRKADPLNTTLVGDVCIRNVYSIDYKRPIDEAIRSLVELGISSLLVTKADKPAGVLTVRDIFELAVANTAEVKTKTLISGLDERSEEYEQEIKDKLESITNRIDRFGKIKVDYISLHIKKSKARNYEMRARIALAKGGTISSSSFGYSLDGALNNLIERLYEEVKEKKELILANRKDATGSNRKGVIKPYEE